ncbi:hypothetical protein TL16_g07905 [Triparma laevis f. inornata]|uniref:Uncharacterized protein n=2 Tax=Triparma laevis TaxID=1534972 RepID=A0A9W7KY50_9STRA|nr:hypothetical protein TL16_g07905 [Triparma laevis f. inornata]GMI15709.1 hypothetical protein TrLO_g14058 [Triparma laevis f. longispina]
MNGPTCSADGLSLDGTDDWADIDDWEWGGTTSFEVYVKYESFNSQSRVFDFGNGMSSDSNNVFLYNYMATSEIVWGVLQGSSGKYLLMSSYDSSTWTHVVVTVSDTTMKIFAAAQIIVNLPTIVPAMSIPDNMKEAMKAASFLNVDVFNWVSVGCWTGGVGYYDKTLYMTLATTGSCALFIFIGGLLKKHRSWCFTIAITITYLVLPTVTTTIFGLFPCDSLDNDSSMLRKDYSISCFDGDKRFWVMCGWLMVLVFPIGVVAMYNLVLRSKKARLMSSVVERLEDEEITPLMFL